MYLVFNTLIEFDSKSSGEEKEEQWPRSKYDVSRRVLKLQLFCVTEYINLSESIVPKVEATRNVFWLVQNKQKQVT